MTIPIPSSRRAAAAIFLLVLPFLAATAQDRYVEIAARHQRPLAYDEVIVLPGSGKAQAVISFRIPNPLLVFVQDRDAFLSDLELTVSLYRNGEQVDEKIWRGEQRAATFGATQDRTEDVEGRVVFRLDPGDYSYRLVLNDGPASGNRPLQISDLDAEGMGEPFFVEDLVREATEVRLVPVNLGGDAPYGRAAATLVPLGAQVSDPGAEIEYRLYRVGRDRRDSPRRRDGRAHSMESSFQLEAGDVLVEQGTVDLDSTVPVGRIDEACLCWDTPDQAEGRLARLELPINELEDAEYVLDLVLKGTGESRSRRSMFRTHWRDMPLSLYDPVVAIRNLRFIESRENVREMLKGSREERIDRFRAYWRQRDPSPGTVFNELMDEYYRRIDHAAFEFRSGKNRFPDGLLTDAAGVFIVHGPPDDVSNSFPSSGGVEEVWAYTDGRRFVFWAPSSLEPMELQEEQAPDGRAERED